MAARVEQVADAKPIAQEIDKIVKYRDKENAGIDTLAGVAKLMQDYVTEETDPKKKAKAKKIANDLNTMANKLWSEYQSATKKMQDKAKEIRKI